MSNLIDEITRFVATSLRTKQEHGTESARKPSTGHGFHTQKPEGQVHGSGSRCLPFRSRRRPWPDGHPRDAEEYWGRDSHVPARRRRAEERRVGTECVSTFKYR